MFQQRRPDRKIIYIVASFVFLLLLLSISHKHVLPSSYSFSSFSSSSSSSKYNSKKYSWNGYTPILTIQNQECRDNFPDLYQTIYEARDHWNETIISYDYFTEKTLPSCVHFKIMNNALYLEGAHPRFQERWTASIGQLHQAIVSSTDPLPDIQAYICAEDVPPTHQGPAFSYTRKVGNHAPFLIPDFGLSAWSLPKLGPWRDYANATLHHTEWDHKKDIFFYRGDIRLNPNRVNMYTVAKEYTWSDVAATMWSNLSTIVDLPSHCDYKYLAQTEGFSYSGRMKYLLLCGSVVITPPLEWDQHFHHLLSPDNYGLIDSWDDLPEYMDFLMGDDSLAREIASNAEQTFRKYLSPEANICYWRELIKVYSSILDFEVVRGDSVAYEDVLVTGALDWDRQ